MLHSVANHVLYRVGIYGLVGLFLTACGGDGGSGGDGTITPSYTVSAVASTGGSISPDSVTVTHGATTDFTLTPDTGYGIDSVTGCGGSLSGNTYTTGAVTVDCTVMASFVLLPTTTPTYTVSTVASTGGSISPDSVTVTHGATTDFTLTPDTGYGIDSVTGCGGSLSGNTYTTGAVTVDCTVMASFVLLSPTTPTSPTLLLTPQSVKTFHFSWTDVAGETEYRLLEDPDSTSGYTQVASIAADATSQDLVVFLPKRINARYILQACNSGGCSDSDAVFVTGTLVAAVGYVKASNTGAYDRFGFSVALSGDGNTLAVGAISEDSSSTGVSSTPNEDAIEAGAVYVFSRSGAVWSQQAYVKASNTGMQDSFGWSVALSGDGNTLAVGAPYEDSSTTGVGSTPNDGAIEAGAVYVFTRSGATWSEQAYVKTSNTGMYDSFGFSVVLSGDGNTLAVGAPGEDSSTTGVGSIPNEAAINAGAVYIFTRSGATWSEQAYVKASNTETEDGFGGAVALSGDGNTLAVGADGEDSSSTGVGSTPNEMAPEAGAVYVFTRSGTDWSQQAYVKASESNSEDYFGWSVALSGNGNTLAVGAVDYTTDIAAGAVYVFSRSAAAWSQQAYVKAFNTGEADLFSISVALSGDGNTLAVGAYGEDSSTTGVGSTPDEAAGDAGAVYVFSRSGATWSEQAYVKASNTGMYDYFGWSVALSGDGNTLAVGASGENSSSTGVGSTPNEDATASGAVYLY